MELENHLRTLGVWNFTDSVSLVEAEAFAGRIERARNAHAELIGHELGDHA